MAQMLLLPDPKPLDKRLGKKFFRKAPRRPGVYLMRNSAGKVVYVGKAKDLKQRLSNYRLANPDRMARRHLKMVNEVASIDFQFCPTEAAALKTEKKLIRELKPKFNRAGVWQGKPKFLVWRMHESVLELAIVETPQTGWQRHGPLGGGAIYLQRSLARLLWMAVNSERPVTTMPAGWMQGSLELIQIDCGVIGTKLQTVFEQFFFDDPEIFLLWLGERFSRRTIPFERRFIETELKSLKEFADRRSRKEKNKRQMTLL